MIVIFIVSSVNSELSLSNGLLTIMHKSSMVQFRREIDFTKISSKGLIRYVKLYCPNIFYNQKFLNGERKGVQFQLVVEPPSLLQFRTILFAERYQRESKTLRSVRPSVVESHSTPVNFRGRMSTRHSRRTLTRVRLTSRSYKIDHYLTLLRGLETRPSSITSPTRWYYFY